MESLKISVVHITLDNLKKGRLKKSLPEFYKLKKVVENNGWHNHDSVFNHSLSTLRALNKILRNVKSRIKLRLKSKIDDYAKADLLRLGALFHDIGKLNTKCKVGEIVTFPNHERVGAKIAGKILNRFDLSHSEIAIVQKIIKCHGEIHKLLKSDRGRLKRNFSGFKKKRKDFYLELILLGWADTLGSQLKKNDFQNFRRRINLYQRALRDY